MKVCLYLEANEILKSCGIGNAFKLQMKALDLNRVEHTKNIKDDYDIIHIFTIGPRSFLLSKVLKKHGKKTVISTHTTAEDFKDSYNFSGNVTKIFRRYLSTFYGQADLLISPTEYAKSLIKSYGVRKEIKVISNGVDLDKFRFSKQKRRKYRKKFSLSDTVIFSVGQVFIRKGVLNFLNVARRIPECQFIWFGPIFNYLLIGSLGLRRAIKNPPSNLQFTGYVEDIMAAYSSGDIFMFPSFEENQGIAILEAAAMGHPLVVRDIPAYESWLVNGENCLKAKNDVEFTEYIKNLTKDTKLRKKLSKNSIKMAKEHDLKIIGKQLKQAYESLLDL